MSIARYIAFYRLFCVLTRPIISSYDGKAIFFVEFGALAVGHSRHNVL